MKLEIADTKKRIWELSQNGVMDDRVLEALRFGDAFVPKETELWDYKLQPSGEAEWLSKTVLQIVSFYNTYGGYLLYGIHEDSGFIAVGVDVPSINEKQIRDRLRAYTGETIDVTFALVPFSTKGGIVQIGLLHVPKRPKKSSPVYFGKNGPSVNGKLLFAKDQAYIRIQDNCVPALKRLEMQLLFSDRMLEWEEDGILLPRREVPLFNNLPDRSLICSRFIGRDEIIERLWRWLGDEFAYVKVLAGAGGKGKTSIAYEFSEEVCRTRPYGFEKVIWLTGKKAQFIGYKNEFANLPETHFNDLSSLLLALAKELAVTDVEIDGGSVNLLKKKIRENLTILPSFVVVDDVDSLEPDQQKMVMEAAMQICGVNSRVLLTTRMNLTFSSDMCIDVPGLERKDFDDLLDVYSERFHVKVSKESIDKLYRVTDGSPLMTESIFRLVKLDLPFEQAVAKWKGESGEAVRKAALLREVQSLSPEARRLLLALSYLVEASGAELRQVTGYDVERFGKCINELSALFLISSPPLIRTESRYRVDSTTRLLVTQNAHDFVVDPRVIEKEVKQLRKSGGQVIREGKRREVGIAINQAMALLKEARPDEAVKTLDAALQKAKRHPDLLLTKGRCLLQIGSHRNDEARKLFKAAYDSGQRKEMLYELWWESEREAKHPSGMVEVAGLAISDEVAGANEWHLRRALGYWGLAKDHSGASNFESALREMRAGAVDVWYVQKNGNADEKGQAEEALERFHEASWSLATQADDRNSWVIGFDVAIEAISHGDRRSENFVRAIEMLEKLVAETETKSETFRNFIEQRSRIIEGHLSKVLDRRLEADLVSRIGLIRSDLSHK